MFLPLIPLNLPSNPPPLPEPVPLVTYASTQNTLESSTFSESSGMKERIVHNLNSEKSEQTNLMLGTLEKYYSGSENNIKYEKVLSVLSQMTENLSQMNDNALASAYIDCIHEVIKLYSSDDFTKIDLQKLIHFESLETKDSISNSLSKFTPDPDLQKQVISLVLQKLVNTDILLDSFTFEPSLVGNNADANQKTPGEIISKELREIVIINLSDILSGETIINDSVNMNLTIIYPNQQKALINLLTSDIHSKVQEPIVASVGVTNSYPDIVHLSFPSGTLEDRSFHFNELRGVVDQRSETLFFGNPVVATLGAFVTTFAIGCTIAHGMKKPNQSPQETNYSLEQMGIDLLEINHQSTGLEQENNTFKHTHYKIRVLPEDFEFYEYMGITGKYSILPKEQNEPLFSLLQEIRNNPSTLLKESEMNSMNPFVLMVIEPNQNYQVTGTQFKVHIFGLIEGIDHVSNSTTILGKEDYELIFYRLNLNSFHCSQEKFSSTYPSIIDAINRKSD